MPTLALASDHGGFALKEALKGHLRARGHEVIDVGTHSAEACDYPVFARAAAEAVASGRAWRGVVVDGAGIGSAMVANKVPGVRAGMAFDEATARNAGEHNGANVLTLGAGYLDEPKAKAIVDAFLAAECTVDRHKKRVAMIDALDGAAGRGLATAGTGTGGSPPPMTTAAGDHAQLVDTIVRVLKSNPGLLGAAGHAAGAPGNVCMTCNPCAGNCAEKGPETVRSMLGGGAGATCNARVSAGLGVGDMPPDLAALIDHTLLKPEATYAEIDQLCFEAAKCGFKSVCVNPVHVKRCADHLRGKSPVVCTVIGFPLGATPKENKVLEARRALRDGASEIDMVLNVGALKSGDLRLVYDDIRAVAEAAREGRAILKVILETALLTDEEKVQACVLSKKARAHFVKTSTGFAKGGATEHDVALMAKAVDYQLEVKASGGVKSAEDARKMIAAGATRIGASVGLKIAGCDVPQSASAGAAY